MARGVDELVNHVLSEIALTGVQGAGSADYKRFVQSFYCNSQSDNDAEPQLDSNRVSPALYQKVWQWVIDHADIRIVHNGEARRYTLAEFEEAENPKADSTSSAPAAQPVVPSTTANGKPRPAKSLFALRASVRQRLAKEGFGATAIAAHSSSTLQTSSSSQDNGAEPRFTHSSQHNITRAARILPTASKKLDTVFDDPQTSTAAPRLFASQNRIWQALTGHGIDLKKVPTMEFVLLSLIASHGEAGVTQPDLTMMSGQDKRSVPHRTDELSRKGYIEKRSVQSGKLRTSLCVHKKFVSDDHFLNSGRVEDVFQIKKFVVSGFPHLLYNTLKDAGVVPTRDIRKRLNVPMTTWNKRAVQGALIRLDQTGMIKRFRARRKDAEENWLTCIEVLREPRSEDHENLRFRRQAAIEEADEEQSDEDVDGDTMMQDLEADMLNVDAQKVEGGKEDAGRVPPQWIPERILSNTLHEVVAKGGSEGWDAGMLRDRIVGKFWRRPMESYLTRLTDNWEATQPPHLRHLALIRDTRNTQEKKFVHYVYRTYGNFQKAVDAGEVIWAGVSKPAPKQSAAKGGRPKKADSDQPPIDAWGFRSLNSKDFLNSDGSGSLAECRAAIVHGRQYGPRWDNSIVEDIGYQKIETPKTEISRRKSDMSRSKAKTQTRLNFSAHTSPRPESSPATPIRQGSLIADAATDSEDATVVAAARVMGLPKRKYENGLLTIEQRIALGLKPKGRLSKFVEDQIRKHREGTGDMSIPDSIELERPAGTPAPPKLGPLMSKEERIAAGLPPRGRLGQKIEDQIREQRGLPKSAEKVKKPRKNRPAGEPALLSKEQRISLGIVPHGRLHQSLIEGLREEREFGISLEQSRVVPVYLDAVKDNKSKPELTRAIDQVRLQTLQEHDPGRGLDQADTVILNPDDNEDPTEAAAMEQRLQAEKRKADGDTSVPQPSKRVRLAREGPTTDADANIPTSPPTETADATEMVGEEVQPSTTAAVAAGVDEEVEPVVTATPTPTNHEITEPARETSPVIDINEVGAKVRLIKDTYITRTAPGLYLDPFAKRKIGQGRPRNAFIATFRLSQLSSLEWFAQNSILRSEDAKEADQAEPDAKSNAADLHTKPLLSADADVAVDNAAQVVLSPSSGQPISRPASLEPAAAHITDAATADHPSITVEPVKVALSTGATAEPLQADEHPLQEPTRPVAGWNAINKPSEPTTAYQSPYAPSNGLDTGSVSAQAPKSVTVEQTEQDSGNENNIQGLFGPITEEDMISRSARKLAAYMGTKTGGGSQKAFRHRIIMQIIDLCNGAYPMHGEIGRPFTTLWKEQHPKQPLPGPSTVLAHLREMIADPRNGLKKLTFLMKLRQSSGVKKRDMVVYQHLSPTSPVVTKLAYKMANYSNSKAHQFYPEEIRHLVSDESFYVPVPVAPKDETISLERLNPSLQHKIKEANLERRRRYYHKQKDEESARDAQNAGVEAPLRKTSKSDSQPRAKRARLASLNDKNKRYRRAPLSNTAAPMDPELEENIDADADDETQESQTLTWKEPWVGPSVRNDVASTQQRRDTGQIVATTKCLVSSIMSPIVRFYATNGTISTEFGLIRQADLLNTTSRAKVITTSEAKQKGTKRVRIVEPVSQRPTKKARVGLVKARPVHQPLLVVSSSDESATSYSSSTSSSSDDEDDVPLMQLSKAQARAKAKAKANAKAKVKARAKAKAKAEQRDSKKDPAPTLLERLTGLTGDPDKDFYVQPMPKAASQKTYQSWNERKKARTKKLHRQRKYGESQDPVDKFKKLFCALIIAFSMAGGQDQVDWGIVERVHNSKGFDLGKTKTLWAWMRVNMSSQIAELTADFEGRFLDAYENGKIAAIEDPSTYNWANLVRWAMHTCVYPELALPVYQEALQQFIVDLSSYEAFDRPKWHRERIADRVRTQIQLQYSYTAPLHRKPAPGHNVDKTELKARSWIRANTATPQDLYDSKTAHEKLRLLGDPVLTKVVGEYVDRQMLRMRKFKRLLPGRNYTFTAKFAKKYGRTFELNDFMAAIKIKKAMDAAFVQEDPEKRVYSISRAEPDGAIMAVMSLLSQGKVNFTPQVPSVNNEFGSPLPRLSVWGFMEGDYVHRGIDRQRMFWDVYVVPTETYDYGNPLQPDPAPSSDEASSPIVWSPLPLPPLPGKEDSNALLPIWSTMDGQHVTWPWWYRILNLVLQPLIFQPGATVEDIHANCDECTTEIFEIELVLQWLVSVNAAKKTIGGGYITLPGVWAAFGDVLHDMENDWLNAHVKRKQHKHQKQQWREKYHLRFSTLQGKSAGRFAIDASDESDTPTDDEQDGVASTGTEIMRHPKEQYGIVRDQVTAVTTTGVDRSVEATEEAAHPPAAASATDQDQRIGAASLNQDSEMRDVDADGELDGEGDVDV